MGAMIVVTGSTGYLGHYVVRELDARGVPHCTAGRVAGCDVRIDLLDPASIRPAVEGLAPATILNVGALSAMGACEQEPDLAMRTNALAVAEWAALGVRLVQVSTDLVFDGRSAPYLPTGDVQPLSAYGRSKAEGEVAALRAEDALVVRIPLLFGPSHDGAHGATDMLQPGRSLGLFTNEYRTPLHVADAARLLVDLALDEARRGIVHLAGPERLSRWDFARRYAEIAHVDGRAWRPTVAVDPLRPRDVSMISDLRIGRSLDAALDPVESARTPDSIPRPHEVHPQRSRRQLH